jgi:hypothetical protein
MVRALCMACTVLTLSSCADLRYREWEQSARSKAEQGQMQWSEYYRGCFTRLVDAPYGRVPEMELCNTLIDYAMALEGGKMSASEFDIKRRQAQLDYARRKDAAGTNVFVPASF